jgi:wobble nucleotide-excising tRNase
VATYDSAGIEIDNLRKVNFIYGVNGSGKTTISNYLQQMDDPKYASCSLVWENDLPINLLVYNKKFREKNFSGSIKGVFTLGQATKEEIETIEKKKEDLQALKNKEISENNALEKQTKEKEELEDDFKEVSWKVYKKHESPFKEAFIGFLKKDSFKSKLLEEYLENTSILLSHEKLKEKARTVFGEIPTTISTMPNINFDRFIEIENNIIWQKKVIGKSDVDISKLIQKLNLNDWVNEGRGYLQEDDICPFCQQKTINEKFRKQLDDYFDESFINDTKLIKELTEEYERLATNLLNELNVLETSEKNKKETKLNIKLFSEYLKTLSSQIISNKELFHNKNKEPSRSIELNSLQKQLESIQELISSGNEEIRKHNIIVENYVAEKTNLIKSIWKYIVKENEPAIRNFIKKRDGLQKGIETISKNKDELHKKYQNLDKEIKELGKNITSVQPSVDQINKALQSFGFHNFAIVSSPVEKNHYQIQREDRTLAESTLSEGEITFITFLYFLQLAKGGISEDNVTEDRILVIDDPISSLDSNVLFVVSSLLKEIRKTMYKNEGNIKQMVIFTHNVYFHKEVSFIDGRTYERGDAHYWILRKNRNCSSIQPFGIKNPIQNSYELLWKELKELKNRKFNSSTTIQNTMRRIIENYFKILGKYGDDELILKFTDKEEQEICRALLCWINDGSHCIPDDLFIEEQGDVTENYFDVFKNIFAHTNHLEHYEMMMKDEVIEATQNNP